MASPLLRRALSPRNGQSLGSADRKQASKYDRKILKSPPAGRKLGGKENIQSSLQREVEHLRIENEMLQNTVTDLKFAIAELEAEKACGFSPSSFDADFRFEQHSPIDWSQLVDIASPNQGGSPASYKSASEPPPNDPKQKLRNFLKRISTPPATKSTRFPESESFSFVGTGVSVLDKLSENVRDDVVMHFKNHILQHERGGDFEQQSPTGEKRSHGEASESVCVSNWSWAPENDERALPMSFCRQNRGEHFSPTDIIAAATMEEHSTQQLPEKLRFSKHDLFSRCRHNRLGVLRLGLDGQSVHFRDNDLNTPLHIAAQNGLRALTKLCLQRGADIDAQNSRGNTAPVLF